MNAYQTVNTPEQLAHLCRSLETEQKIAVDLEADSMHHFTEKVCLVQIGSSKGVFIIDPLQTDRMDLLEPVMADPSVEKVMHGADFDIRSLDRDFGIRVSNLFDTEIACKIIGIRERGLAALAKKYCNADLDKKFQKTDWTRRPLTDDKLSYCADDVAYLFRISDILKKTLLEKGRLEWVKQECENQVRVRFEPNHDSPLFVKFKGAGKMDSRTLTVLEYLLQMRVKIAEKKDLPLFKVMGTHSLSTMAWKKPVTKDMLKRSGALSDKQMSMYADQCIRAVQEALELPGAKLFTYPKTRGTRLSDIEQKRIKALKKMRTEKSAAMEIEEGFLLNNALIAALAKANPAVRQDVFEMENISPWQADLLADDILQVLQGLR
ncbi:MAG: HRDC domain-containing protein [Desulfarculaceae bacterium]|nr:HRDC domain-containing protein [Desulfarculaceae bacterium]